MAAIIINPKERLQVREVPLPVTQGILGTGIDVTTLPEGHLVCPKCKTPKFECWMYGDNHRVEMGCMECGESTRLHFPTDIKLDDVAGSQQYFGKGDAVLPHGRFQCMKHPDKGMVLIHNVDVISIGCEKCFTEINICLRKSKGMVIVDG